MNLLRVKHRGQRVRRGVIFKGFRALGRRPEILPFTAVHGKENQLVFRDAHDGPVALFQVCIQNRSLPGLKVNFFQILPPLPGFVHALNVHHDRIPVSKESPAESLPAAEFHDFCAVHPVRVNLHQIRRFRRGFGTLKQVEMIAEIKNIVSEVALRHRQIGSTVCAVVLAVRGRAQIGLGHGLKINIKQVRACRLNILKQIHPIRRRCLACYVVVQRDMFKFCRALHLILRGTLRGALSRTRGCLDGFVFSSLYMKSVQTPEPRRE